MSGSMVPFVWPRADRGRPHLRHPHRRFGARHGVWLLTQDAPGNRRGALTGIRVLEMAAIGPAPHCAMLLADLGAEVLRIDRIGGNGWRNPIVDRGRETLELDLRSPEGQAQCRALAAAVDVVIEGYRPGVMERLGVGPDVLLELNPRLIYGRMTGWGQTGPLAQAAGHDLNYIALTGALAAMGEPGRPPQPPLNLVGDFGGGSMFLALGVVAALFERQKSGLGQVVDAAIVDGVASLMAMFAGLAPSGEISLERGESVLGGRAPFYRCYECSDGEYVAVGAVENHFYVELLARIGAPAELGKAQNDVNTWGEQAKTLAALFQTKSRDEWCALLEGTDACFAPVLSLQESYSHRQMLARNTHIRGPNGMVQAAPAPRFSRTPGGFYASEDPRNLARRWGVSLDGNV
jgi:alpha-methylacyl-CoA racemase